MAQKSQKCSLQRATNVVFQNLRLEPPTKNFASTIFETALRAVLIHDLSTELIRDQRFSGVTELIRSQRF